MFNRRPYCPQSNTVTTSSFLHIQKFPKQFIWPTHGHNPKLHVQPNLHLFATGKAIYNVSGTTGYSLTFLGWFPSIYSSTSPIVGATLAGSMGILEWTINPSPTPRLLFTIDFSCCITTTPGLFFLCGTSTYLSLPTNWTGTCTLVYSSPNILIAPSDQPLPIPLIHKWIKQAIHFNPLLVGIGIAAGIGTGIAGLTTSIQNYQTLSKDLSDSLQEIAQGLITIQNKLDSLVSIVLENRRLDILTIEKGELCLFPEESCCFYANQSFIAQGATKNLPDPASWIRQRLNNAWQSWLTDWNWMPWVLRLLGPFIFIILLLTFEPCLFNFFQGLLQDQIRAISWD